ncbi:hypothetical protein ACS0TY_017635 [Phlomoides rotata]
MASYKKLFSVLGLLVIVSIFLVSFQRAASHDHTKKTIEMNKYVYRRMGEDIGVSEYQSAWPGPKKPCCDWSRDLSCCP